MPLSRTLAPLGAAIGLMGALVLGACGSKPGAGGAGGNGGGGPSGNLQG